MSVAIKRLDSADSGFYAQLDALLAWEPAADAQVEQTVRGIIADIRGRGDAALLEYTNRFDRMRAASVAELEIGQVKLQQALDGIPAQQHEALQRAAERVRAYAEHQKMQSWSYTEADGTVLGQQVTPLDRAGLYVPGGKAAYPSSVLMNAIPAKVAGVSELVMVVPTPDGVGRGGRCRPGIRHRRRPGGCGAGLRHRRVDKIVGPGNIYVATAKGMVFGDVGIDMIAGPSEILVVCDGRTDPDWIAMDLFSQAEHDEDAQAILVCPDAAFLERVAASIEKQLPNMERRELIGASLAGRGALIKVRDLDEAVGVANHIAPEHLELSVEDPQAMAVQIRHAGAIFMGRYTAEALGDYCAGPNHVLPTSRTARFSSPLGVYDFQKRSSLIYCSPAAAAELGATASTLARGEGLTAHARSAEFRVGRE